MTPASDLLDFELPLRGARAFVTGHTGFTGGWLVSWLKRIGSDVAGLALAPATHPSLFVAGHVANDIASTIGDIRDFATVRDAMARHRPQVIIHLAAQPLVSKSFANPIETFATNALGTAHVLEAARLTPDVKAVVCITTDKVYRDQDWVWGYREQDPLGGKDPYSASKACAELIAASYRATLAERGNSVLIANARGGNIIGGGDWSADRIVPDFVRAVTAGQPISLRNPSAVRPWQHVMALVHGYLVLAARLLSGDNSVADNWNFGPSDEAARTVGNLVEQLSTVWARPEIIYAPGSFPETRFLHLDSTKARSRLGWAPPLSFEDTIDLTASWYRDFTANPSDGMQITVRQIEHYRNALRSHAGR
ncbi:CDP-glucose 4,6-dehydratase [Bradyrhizobium sacchari]|uniref:CDP-glucose 4,6-dehydratase n=1 Tax=Bradyrhizobium sacchari TaxID=1399419 RepID=A0A560JNB3_9BRAD|nr:CDP-glucose 4,6-dehydratase [Bradyrhizobium sacchari]OPY97877.1 CDP-glucose 4,6-dehydratase [Bradyrhizobium sacchari]TWB59193.1 CDP-glucose 4,6-dehydratase [Bradyrhizobium sacchari]TWB72447.1 CDP-glucose 4,6-dehydratase [Bradyrhizobium sacchari]